MPDRNLHAHESAGDQVVTMTIVVVGFAAHERDSAGRPEFDQPLDRRKVKRRGSHPVIIYLSLAKVKLGAVRPASQLSPHICVHYARAGQGSSQRLLIELRRVSAERLAARIDELIDAMLEEQSQEPVDLDIAVSNAEQGHKSEIIPEKSRASLESSAVVPVANGAQFLT
jgi:hypothetical protein